MFSFELDRSCFNALKSSVNIYYFSDRLEIRASNSALPLLTFRLTRVM